MVRRVAVCFLPFAFAIQLPSSGLAQGDAKTLIVGTKEAVPFVMRDADGEWTGPAIYLWEEIALELGVRTEFREATLAELVSGVADGTLDVSAGALTITAERETQIDFTHAFFETGLAIAVTAKEEGMLSRMRAFLNRGFLRAVMSLAVVLLLVGVVVWFAERRRNPTQFGGTVLHGLGAGFWWSAVTMTTVGYGDKAPVSLAGRLVGLVWMFASIMMISGFTASITTSLTMGSFEGKVRGPRDLSRVRVAAVPQSTTASYLERREIQYTAVPTPEAGLEALGEGRVDAVVHDAPVLRYLTNAEFADEIRILPGTFATQRYAFAVRQGSELREPINRALLGKLGTDEWRATLRGVMGG